MFSFFVAHEIMCLIMYGILESMKYGIEFTSAQEQYFLSYTTSNHCNVIFECTQKTLL